jgi:hypothetical protein
MAGKDTVRRFIAMENVPTICVPAWLAVARKTVQIPIGYDFAGRLDPRRLHCFPELFNNHGKDNPHKWRANLPRYKFLGLTGHSNQLVYESPDMLPGLDHQQQ